MVAKNNGLMTMEDTVPDVAVAIEQWNAYQKLCGKGGILNESDYQKIWVKEKNPETGKYEIVEREFKKKSAWQKLARAFNVNTHIVSKEFQRTSTGRIKEAYYCVCATLPNGRSVESDALCSRSEKGKDKVSDHTIMSTAKTRATNRAIGELIGAGEVSSEEMLAELKPVLENEADVDANVVDEIPSKQCQEFKHEDAPKLITECIDGLMARGMKITNELVKTCIESRFESDAEYEECMSFLDNIKLEEAL